MRRASVVLMVLAGFACCQANADVAASPAWLFDSRTGRVSAFCNAQGDVVAQDLENRYLLMTHAGAAADVEALEREDVVVRRQNDDDWVAFKCTNPKLPGIEIVKRYKAENGGLRRALAFRNTSSKTAYLTPFTDCRFSETFLKGTLYHLGAGYIGPYKPFPRVPAPRVVNDYKQSSKGLVFVHPDAARACFSHYRVKIDNQVVWPWWHSTIGRYREYHDRLWYLPDGYRMCLGTFGLYPNKVISVTDQFNAFDGDIFTFFDGIFGADRDICAELASIPTAPKWFDDVFCCGAGGNDDYMLPWAMKMIDEAHFMPRNWGSFSWGEYVDEIGLRSVQGGRITTAEFAAFMDSMRQSDPSRIHPCHYSIVISASWFTRVFKEHPEWFRVHDRNGNVDSLFPGASDNFQTMFNNPECRKWMVEMAVSYCKRLGNDVVYIDESQQTNTIDWDRDQVTLDSDSVKFWKLLRKRFNEEGIVFWANGSGNPYADLNYMESPDELAPSRWRDWAGVGLGISMINRMKRGNRTSLLVWRKGNDYANRIVALGWIPHPYSSNDVNLPVMRAVWQQGNLFPANVRYTPDWKTDPAVQVESHAMKRTDAADVVLSFINRAAPADIPVAVDLASLGFRPNDRIAVWKLHYDEWRNGTDVRRILADGEIKANWRERGIVAGARVSDPELMYSGPAKGTFSDTIVALGKDMMEQYVVTLAAPAFFATDGQPVHAFFTAQRHGAIDGRTARLDRDADIILADRDFDFTEVSANGAVLPLRKIRLCGGLVATLVHLDKGTWKLAWKASRRSLASKASQAVALPVQPKEPLLSSVPKPKLYIEPERLDITEVGRDIKDGVKLLRKGVFNTSIPMVMRLQEKVPITCTAADADALRLTAGPSHRQFYVRSLETCAGFELQGARQLKLRLAHNYGPDTQGVGRNLYKSGDNAGLATEYFGGIVVDYSVAGKYAKRVAMSVAFYYPGCRLKGAKWGKHGVADECLDFGSWIEDASPKTFSLDLTRFAPPGWDGKAWLTLGTCRFLAGHHLTLDILSFNDAAAKDFEVPVYQKNPRSMPLPLKSTPLRTKPRSLTAIDPAEWKRWTAIDSFWLLQAGRPKAQTKAYIAHDYEYLYVGIDADEPLAPSHAGKEAWSNDHIECLVERSDARIYQVIAAPDSETIHLLDRQRGDPKGIVVRDAAVPGKGWQVFMAIPMDDLKPNMQLTPVTIKMQLARIRKMLDERSSWAPLETGFFERKNYGTVILDFSWTRNN